MSHSFSVNIRTPMYVEHILEEAGIEDLKFLDGYGESKSGLWPDELSYVYRDNISVRSVETENFGSSINIRIFSASSPDDYDLALRLVAAIAKNQGGKISPEDNDVMTLDKFLAFYNSDWALDHSRTMLSMTLGGVQSHPDSVTQITGVHAVMHLGKRVLGQLIKEKARIDTAFYHRLRTLNFIDNQDIYQSNIAVFANQEGSRSVRVSSYTQDVKTLIVDKKTLVSLVSDEDFGKSPTERNLLRVPACDLPNLVGEEAIWLSEHLLLLPGFTGEAWKRFISRAREFHVDDMFKYSYDPKNDPYAGNGAGAGSEITEADLEELAYAPIAVFCFVAAADGNIDKKEIEAFKKEVLTGMSSDHDIIQKILLATVSGGDDLFNEFLNKEVDILEKLNAASSIFDSKLSHKEALQCKRALLKMGLAVAEASGGFLGRFGSKVSKEEKATLASLALIFGVTQ